MRPIARPMIMVLALCIAMPALQACGRSEAPRPAQPPAAAPAGAPPDEAASDATRQAEEAGRPASGVGGYVYEAYAYDCEGTAITVRPGDDELALMLPDRTVLLRQVESASGARYSDGEIEFWGRSINTGLLTLDGEETPCELDRRETPWVDARARGASFRAVGQEPGWQLEIHPDRLLFIYQYGQRRAVAPNPGVVADAEKSLRRWQAATEEHELSVTVEDRACTDVMSGDIHPATVVVILDGREYMGCGRDLEQAARE
jgi:membrane-bound inhibitor of C-type lysozyme